MVHLKWFDRDISGNELKRNILVSPRWCYATEPATRVKYESIHS